MGKMECLKEFTADDVVRTGACVSGVYEVLERLHPNTSALMNVNNLLHLLEEDERHYVVKAAMMDGYGYSDGYSYGYGYSDGCGDGCGDGYSDGYGYGDGNGDGYGYSYGDGNGDGYGYSYGDGNGDGCGDGCGYG